MNRLFVANKPRFITSNHFLSMLKRKYNEKKMGFSGTLDPFASGTLIVASGQYTKLFRFLKKVPKVYEATLMLGLDSSSLDIENVKDVKFIKSFSKEEIKKVLKSFEGEYIHTPPIYSAKKINGVRAYKLAKKEINFELKKIATQIFDIELIDYSHPFISFRVSVSEGTFIRTLGEDIAKRLNSFGSLIYLHREKEGEFKYECEKMLDPINYLNLKKNEYSDKKDLILGKKLDINKFKIKEKGVYVVEFDKYFSIIKIDDKVEYIYNRIEKC